jgi:putative CocE/NonD family hydrolase
MSRSAALALVAALLATSAGAAPLQGVYVPGAEGVRLAVDVRVPDGAGLKPAVLILTRYGRRDRISDKAADLFLSRGFSVVVVDMRGSGASFGTVTSIFTREERADIVKVLDWLSAQPWSNHKVLVTGASHDGSLAELAVASGHPAVVAAIPRFIDYDTYSDLAFPGGIRNEMLLRGWGELTHGLDTAEPCLADAKACDGPGMPAAVDADPDRALLRAALLEHQSNWHAYWDTRGLAFHDDMTPSGRALSEGYLSLLPDVWRRSKTPEQIWASWLDARTADSALARWAASPDAPIELLIGPWAHGGGANLDPLRATPPLSDPKQGEEIAGFAVDAVSERPGFKRRIRYYTMGAGVWRETAQWPPAGLKEQVLAFDTAGALRAGEGREGADLYKVDFASTTGVSNRWTTQLGGSPVRYPDRAEQDQRLLTYTGAPLSRDMEITGAPVASLKLSASRPDGALFVYLEAVAPDGRVIPLSEGQRRIGFATGFSRADYKPVRPGEVFSLSIPLTSLSAVIPKGWRLRTAIAGADADTFARYPADGETQLTVFRGPGGSTLRLPVAPWRPAP